MTDKHSNKIAREGVDRCGNCGCKYWENDRCVDCHVHVSTWGVQAPDNSPEAVEARKAMFKGFGWGVTE